MNDFRLIVESLNRSHDRSSFSCGEPALDGYLQRQASQEQRRDIARVFVAVDRETRRLAAFYTLSSAAIVTEGLPAEVSRRLPHYHHTPALLIGRLAVDQQYQGHGTGRFMLMDALRRAAHVSEDTAVFAVLVDAKNERAQRYYERFGFIPLPESGDRLFLPVATIRKLFEGSG